MAKQPPHDETAERAFLGSLLVFQDAIDRAPWVQPDHLYTPAHKRVLAAIQALHGAGKAVDPVTVEAKLRAAGKLESSGGQEYIHELTQCAMSSERVTDYARIIVDKARIRSVMQVCQEVLTEGESFDGDAQTFVDGAEARLHAVGRKDDEGAFTHLGDATKSLARALAEQAKSGGCRVGQPTGFDTLDSHINGLMPGNVTVIAARPGVGKTSFAMCMALHLSSKGLHVPFFSLEMNVQEMTMRAVSAGFKIDQSHLYFPQILTPREWQDLTGAVGIFQKSKIHLCDHASINVPTIRSMVRRLRSKVERLGERLGAVVVDYLQLMGSTSGKKNETREREVAEVSRGLKQLAGELKVPVIALSQLNRAAESRKDDKPRMSELRESGSIEQDASNVIIIHRKMSKEPEDTTAEVLVEKARNGKPGSFEVKFDGKYTLFYE